VLSRGNTRPGNMSGLPGGLEPSCPPEVGNATRTLGQADAQSKPLGRPSPPGQPKVLTLLQSVNTLLGGLQAIRSVFCRNGKKARSLGHEQSASSNAGIHTTARALRR